jgi:hypothetical protein
VRNSHQSCRCLTSRVVWCGAVLCGVVLCGVVWCGVVRCCVSCAGVECECASESLLEQLCVCDGCSMLLCTSDHPSGRATCAFRCCSIRISSFLNMLMCTSSR